MCLKRSVSIRLSYKTNPENPEQVFSAGGYEALVAQAFYHNQNFLEERKGFQNKDTDVCWRS
jgi:hypothetical protein